MGPGGPGGGGGGTYLNNILAVPALQTKQVGHILHGTYLLEHLETVESDLSCYLLRVQQEEVGDCVSQHLLYRIEGNVVMRG